MSRFVRIVVDWENNAEDWWGHAADSHTTPEEIRDMLQRGNDMVEVTPSRAREIKEWAKGCPSWDTGPDHAPHPLLFQDAGE